MFVVIWGNSLKNMDPHRSTAKKIWRPLKSEYSMHWSSHSITQKDSRSAPSTLHILHRNLFSTSFSQKMFILTAYQLDVSLWRRLHSSHQAVVQYFCYESFISRGIIFLQQQHVFNREMISVTFHLTFAFARQTWKEAKKLSDILKAKEILAPLLAYRSSRSTWRYTIDQDTSIQKRILWERCNITQPCMEESCNLLS